MVSLLLYKPVIKKINPKTLGYVCPNGQINFQSEENALRYTKNIILKGLEQGREIEVNTKGASVLKIIEGDAQSVESKWIETPDIPGAIQHHGHPDINFLTYPFSEQDVKTFMILNKVCGYKKSVIYNSLGEECSLEAKTNSLLSKLKLSITNRLILYYLNPVNRFRLWQLDKSVEKFNKNFHLNSYIKNLSDRCTPSEKSFMKQLKIQPELLRLWVEDKVNALMRHDLLKELSSKLGFEYKANFSHLPE